MRGMILGRTRIVCRQVARGVILCSSAQVSFHGRVVAHLSGVDVAGSQWHNAFVRVSLLTLIALVQLDYLSFVSTRLMEDMFKDVSPCS